jgi:hypothetical protein
MPIRLGHERLIDRRFRLGDLQVNSIDSIDKPSLDLKGLSCR